MRTRSKFSLNDTPLEIIEQAFIPPDITEDMYDSACENDEWMEFLSEFTKPLGLYFIYKHKIELVFILKHNYFSYFPSRVLIIVKIQIFVF